MSQQGRALLFVYNANTGLLELLQHAVHMTVKPETYPCKLCLLTYSPLGMRKRWRKFVGTLPAEPVFLHADELAARHPDLGPVPLPALYDERDGELELLIPAHEMQAVPDLPALESLVRDRVGA